MALTYLHRYHHSTQLKILGDVNLVLNGKVSPLIVQQLSLPTFTFALGAGTFSNVKFLGETLICNQVAHVCFVDPSAQLQTESNAQFVKTPFLMGIDSKDQPDALIRADYSHPIALEALYTTIAEEYSLGFAIVGDALFANLEATYLKKPPIFHENINGDKEDEYWAPKEHLADQRALFFGVVITPKGIEKFTARKVSKAFYQNPKDLTSASFMSHTHAALVDEKISPVMDKETFFARLPTYKINGVRHILTQSLLKEGTCALYKIEDIL
jgi:hypothetical protein